MEQLSYEGIKTSPFDMSTPPKGKLSDTFIEKQLGKIVLSHITSSIVLCKPEMVMAILRQVSIKSNPEYFSLIDKI